MDRALDYDHLAFSENFENSTKGLGASMGSYKIAAGVGLLSRNIRVIGAEYPNQEKDLYGSRIIVSDYSNYDSTNTVLLYYKGYARISNTEFVHPGQFSRDSEDDSKFGIFYNHLLAYDNVRPSYVRDSAFHQCLGTAIGILRSSSIPITNNVIYYTINIAMSIQGLIRIYFENYIKY